MADKAPQPPVRTSSWADTQSRDALRLIVEGVRELAGFDLAGVSVLREDGYLQVITIVGPDDAVAALQDTLAPVGPLLDQLQKADDWGPLKFIPHDRLELDIATWGWFSDEPRIEQEGRWHPEDMLMAPLEDAGGHLIGILGMELPRDGLMPDRAKRDLLAVYARQACHAVVTTLERQQLAEQVRLADAAAEIVRTAAATMTVSQVIDKCGDAVIEGFRASGLFTQLIDADGRPEGPAVPRGHLGELPPTLSELVVRRARTAWEGQRVDVVAPERRPDGLTVQEADRLLSMLTGHGAESVLLVPLGAGPDCLGVLGLTRALHGAEWSEVEAVTALGIGRDLGRALANARTFRREHQLVEELQGLADYRSQLVATVSHELKNPLTAILGYVELLESEPGLGAEAQSWLAAIQRGGGRLRRVVDDLLLLHRTVGDDVRELVDLVDLAPVVEDVVDLQQSVAQAHGVRLECVLGPVPAVRGDVHALDRVVANLVGNAVKYSRDGGDVRVRLAQVGDEVVLTVADTGLGIAAADQALLFTEFFRSSNPEAVARPGTGLGLAIAKRIVDHHRGTIEVDSTLGRGSTFTVRLPTAS